MISVETLHKAAEAQSCLVKCRRILEDVRDHELKEDEWTPGHGEKPHRVRELERMIGTLDDTVGELDKLWS